jgi:serine/threonine-protein kinase
MAQHMERIKNNEMSRLPTGRKETVPKKSRRILSINETIHDIYTIKRFLGESNFTEVYLVKTEHLDSDSRIRALKVFKNPGPNHQDIKLNIKNNLLLSKFRHPNLIEVYDAGAFRSRNERFDFFTMTHISGATLESYRLSIGDTMMPIHHVVSTVKQIASGLSVAHSFTPPIIHSAIGPQNIFIRFSDNDIHVRISDLGLARQISQSRDSPFTRNELGFRAPEVVDGIQSCTADIWAIGTILYLLLTNRMPHPELSHQDKTHSVRILQLLQRPSFYNGKVDGELETIVYRCLAAMPEYRYQHAMALLNDINKWISRHNQSHEPVQDPIISTRRANDTTDKESVSKAKATLKQAFRVARNPNMLLKAAHLLKEAIRNDITLQKRYGNYLRLWSKGITHVSICSFQKGQDTEL